MFTHQYGRENPRQSYTRQARLPEKPAIQHYACTCRQVNRHHRERGGQVLEAQISAQLAQHALQPLVGENRGAWETPLHDMPLDLQQNFLAFGRRFTYQLHTRGNKPAAARRSVVKWYIISYHPPHDSNPPYPSSTTPP